MEAHILSFPMQQQSIKIGLRVWNIGDAIYSIGDQVVTELKMREIFDGFHHSIFKDPSAPPRQKVQKIVYP